jgi:hypothetical protein
MTITMLDLDSNIAPYVEEAQLNPYIPKANLEFAETASDTPIEQFSIEILSQIFSNFDKPSDLANISKVCKRFYNASKVPAIWKSFLQNTLPNVQFVSPSTFTPEQQVKIIFQRIFAERKQLEDKLKTARERISLFSNTDKAIIEMQNAGLLSNSLPLVEVRKLVDYANVASSAELLFNREATYIKRLFERIKQKVRKLKLTVTALELTVQSTKHKDQAKVDSLIRTTEVLAILSTATVPT